MLEKIGLPPKPSVRGKNWVVDASHCQGCSAQFTFINRKHHCRRCGGIFCGSCTQQRMVLRGQGDSPVRICVPCKTLEEAARFEMRHGHKNKADKGSTKVISKKEDEILNQILGNEDKAKKTISSASCSNIPDIADQIDGGDISRILSLDQRTSMLTEMGSATPEDLREQAILEKKKYKTLKAEGKPEEALRAFKRGKELERQAGALELSLRKNRRKVLSSSSLDDTQQMEESSGKSNLSTQKSRTKDDLSAELKELGWSDMDAHDAEKNPANLSLDGELSSLLKEVSQKPNKDKGAMSTNKYQSQVIAHKKKALELKRSGNLIEAKEELKRAKILERKIEEDEFLGEDDDDSDDELSSLIRSMDADGHNKSDFIFNFDQFAGISDDLVVDGNFEVTEEDMDDPEMASALKSLGWTEDTAHSEDFHGQAAVSTNESLLTEVQSLKREALAQKRAGNTMEAMTLLKKAKVLEIELERSGPDLEEALVYTGVNVENANHTSPKLAPKSKLTIQKELIALKKKALSLRREGKVDESQEELEKAKVIEQQLEDMDNTPTVTRPNTVNKQVAIVGDGDDEAVTDQDMHDPSYLSLLKNLGWEDDSNAEIPSSGLKENDGTSKLHIETGTSRKSKSEIQRELLALKREALKLRRQGKVDEADELLEKASSLEAQLKEYEEPIQREVSVGKNKGNASIDAPQNSGPSFLHEIRIKDLGNQEKVGMEEEPEVIGEENVKPNIQEPTVSPLQSSLLQQEILAHKRKAVMLKREGKMAEAKEELRQAKLLEKHVEEKISQTGTNSSDASSVSDHHSSVEKKEASPSSVSKPPLSSRDRFKLQQESLGHKRQALKLRREGRTAEADAEFELAKALESQLEEFDSHNNSSKTAEPVDGVMVEDFLDPLLLSALQSIGLEDARVQTPGVERPESSKLSADSSGNSSNLERELLAERIKAEKVKAVNLKRSGKQAEALDALRRTKLYEKKLQMLTSA